MMHAIANYMVVFGAGGLFGLSANCEHPSESGLLVFCSLSFLFAWFAFIA